MLLSASAQDAKKSNSPVFRLTFKGATTGVAKSQILLQREFVPVYVGFLVISL